MRCEYLCTGHDSEEKLISSNDVCFVSRVALLIPVDGHHIFASHDNFEMSGKRAIANLYAISG